MVPTPAALRRVLVISTHFKPAAHPCAREIAGWFEARGIEVALNLTGEGDVRATAEGCQLVVTVGGDGTILGVARALRGLEVPTIGINIGKLGFLAEFSADDVRRWLDGGPAPFHVVERLMLVCRLGDGPPRYALNDAVLTQGPMARILEIDMEVDGRRATRYFADGVVISTPVGSTAYSLSLGGPILSPGMDAVIVTPIAPHALTNRPLVLEGGARLSFRIRKESPSLALVIDGQEMWPLEQGDEVRIERAGSRFLLASHSDRTQFDILRNKLHWAIQPTGAPEPKVRQAERPPFAAVYLHGFASGPDGTKAQALASQLRARGVAIETPDLNQGPGGFERLTVTRMLEAARAAGARARRLAGLGENAPLVLLGSSLGGYVAALRAARDPRVRALVLLAPAFDFGARFRDALSPEERERLAGGGTIEVDHFATGRREPLGPDLIEDALRYEPFPDVRCPILIVHGRRDAAVPVELSERFAHGRPHARLLVLEDDHRLSSSLDTIGPSVEVFLDAIGEELARGAHR